MVLEHVSVSFVRDGKQVRRHLSTTLAHEHSSNGIGVDGETLVRVDYNTEQAGVGLKYHYFKIFQCIPEYELVSYEKRYRCTFSFQKRVKWLT